MKKFPEKLIDSLKALGLYESEAKVYSALVLLDRAEPRELVEALDISKPSVYEGLRSLEERGLILQTSVKPTVYQPVEPRIALRMLMDTYDRARDEAAEFLEELRKARVKEKSAGSNLWSIYGSNTIDYKVRDMIENAKEKVYIGLAERFRGYLDWLEGRDDLETSIIFFSDDAAEVKRLEDRFKGTKVVLKVISIDFITKTKNAYIGAAGGAGAGKMLDYNNMLVLITDDRESLYVPPLQVEEINALYTNNPVLISSSSIFFASPATASRERP